MKPIMWISAALLVLTLHPFVLGQDVQVSRENKTIAVTTDEELVVDAEFAILKIGYTNYAATSEAAFDQNVQVSNRITKAISDAGVPASEIETETLRVTRIDPDERWSAELKKERQFQAQQSWEVRAPVNQAQSIMDMAIRAGANGVADVEWTVGDPSALQAKASGAALAKARRVADQMANGLGAKLGDLVYASNRAPVPKFWRGFSGASSQSSMVASVAREHPKPALKLYPQKVKSEATVHAVFAIQ